MKLLLHACCGPCLLAVAPKLKTDGHELTAYFFNPNIHPLAEQTRRIEAFEQAAAWLEIPVLPVPGYEPQSYFRAVTFREDERCRLCYRVRLFEAGLACRDDGCEAFTTTLLVSPYQQQDGIREAGEAAAQAAGVGFLFEDFRPLFGSERPVTTELGMYRQKYCGCLYSEIEAAKARNAKAARRGAGAPEP